MRWIITVVIVFTVESYMYAQWNYNGASIYYNNGHVGIGTASPSNIQGWSRVLDVSGYQHSKILTTTNDGVYRMGMYAHVNGWFGGGGFIGTESNHDLYFNTNYDPKMILTTSGNFGVGVLGPTQKLDVAGRVKFRAFSGVSAGAWFTDQSGNESAFLGLTGATSNDPLGIWHGSAWRFAVTQSGNVGIGTNNPVTKLQVDINSLNNAYAAATVGIYSRNTNATDNNYNGLQFGDASGWGVAGIMTQVKSHANHTASMSFFTRKNGATPTPQMTLDEDGQLGIGTTTPDSKLTVKGTIHTQEVKVDLNGSVAPDYVFEKGYDLTSLEELKSYIDQNKHLPEIPSAKEMEKDGINLKEMNLLLLRKIEEMTLYLIEQNQQLARLKEESRVRAEDSKEKLEKLTIEVLELREQIQSIGRN